MYLVERNVCRLQKLTVQYIKLFEIVDKFINSEWNVLAARLSPGDELNHFIIIHFFNNKAHAA